MYGISPVRFIKITIKNIGDSIFIRPLRWSLLPRFSWSAINEIGRVIVDARGVGDTHTEERKIIQIVIRGIQNKGDTVKIREVEGSKLEKISTSIKI